MLCKTLFEDKRVHNNFLCAQNFCSDISSNEKERLLPKRFNHNKLKDYWWLCFAEGEGMYCLLCKNFDVKHALNKRDVFANTPSTRYIEDSLKTHSLSYVHKSAIQTELSQKTSVFHKDVCTKAKVEVSLYEKVFWTVYFLMKSFISNNKLQPMLDHIEKVYDYNDLKFFDHKSAESKEKSF